MCQTAIMTPFPVAIIVAIESWLGPTNDVS